MELPPPGTNAETETMAINESGEYYLYLYEFHD
jgi:hypothetical protein